MALIMPALKARFGPGPLKRPGGHFSGMFLVDQSLQRDPERHMRPVPQEALEKILSVRAGELGIAIRRGVTVEGFEQGDDGVTVKTSAGALSALYSLAATVAGAASASSPALRSPAPIRPSPAIRLPSSSMPPRSSPGGGIERRVVSSWPA